MPSAQPLIPADPTPLVERSRPLLGTWVRISLSGPDTDLTHRAIDGAFEVVGQVHRLMSFHESGSDLSRLNREAATAPVTVHSRTFEVFALALEIAAASAGRFDPTIAVRAVESGWLPRPPGAPAGDPGASWRDIELLPPDRIRFRRPLWADLGGIAKGYAVDAALEAIGPDASSVCRINAGGDLRVRGPRTDRVLLRVPGHAADARPVVELRNASLASSTPDQPHRSGAPGRAGPHFHGVSRTAVGPGQFVSVIAERCAVADALTKVVLADGPGCDAVLRRYGATAYRHAQAAGWQTLGIGR